MFAGALPLVWRLSIVLLAGIAAGIANGIAGGGTFITFPTLLSLGVPALTANITTTVGVVPSYIGSLRVFRDQLRPHKQLLISLLPSILLGTALGTALLLNGSASTFRSIVPWLVILAVCMVIIQPKVAKKLAARGPRAEHGGLGLRVGVFLAGVYGGYFGAGMGILLLAVLALAMPYEILELQGLRNAISLGINIVAALIFVVHGHLAWKYVVMLLIGTLIGGWLGALLLTKLSPLVVRLLVIAIGVATTIKLALS